MVSNCFWTLSPQSPAGRCYLCRTLCVIWDKAHVGDVIVNYVTPSTFSLMIWKLLSLSLSSTGTMFFPTVTFWATNGLLLLVDTTGKPSFITRYRIQMDKNNPVGSRLLICFTLSASLGHIGLWPCLTSDPLTAIRSDFMAFDCGARS